MSSTIDAVDTAQALPPADREAADDLRGIARILARAGWKIAERRVGYKDGIALKTKVVPGLRGRG